MSGKKYAGCLGMVLLLCVVGACGGLEADETQYKVVPPAFSADQVDLHDSLLLDPMPNMTVKIRVDNTDPTVKRPDSTLVRPKQRPPKADIDIEKVDDDVQRDLVRCGENWVDIYSDPEHCGACFAACATPKCVDGACVTGH